MQLPHSHGGNAGSNSAGDAKTGAQAIVLFDPNLAQAIELPRMFPHPADAASCQCRRVASIALAKRPPGSDTIPAARGLGGGFPADIVRRARSSLVRALGLTVRSASRRPSACGIGQFIQLNQGVAELSPGGWVLVLGRLRWRGP
jgi:hypothetical protein